MAESVRVSNMPDSGSPQRVALDLTNRIAQHEDGVKKDRTYWLDLYHRCLSVTQGVPPKNYG